MDWIQGGLENPGRREISAQPAARFSAHVGAGRPVAVADAGRRRARCGDGGAAAVLLRRRPSPRCGGCIRTTARPSANISARPASSRSCTRSACAATSWTRTLAGPEPLQGFRPGQAPRGREFAETTALKIGLPWVNAEYDETRALMGDDFWSYGLNPGNRKTLEAMARYSYEQGLAVRLLTSKRCSPKAPSAARPESRRTCRSSSSAARTPR